MKKIRKSKPRVAVAKKTNRKAAARRKVTLINLSKQISKKSSVSTRKTLIKRKISRPVAEALVRTPEIQPRSEYQTPVFTPEADRPAVESALPFSYNKTKLVLMIRDPYSIFCYWDFTGETWNWAQSMIASHDGNCRVVLRVLEVTGIDYNGSNALSSFDIDVILDARNWYVHVNKPETEWIFELGLIDPHGKYYLIVRGNRVKTPRDGPSNVIDEEWMAVDFDEIYALSGGFGAGLSSGEIGKLIKERYLLQKALFSSFSRNLNPLNPQKAT